MRVFAIRNFLKLGENANCLVKWNAFDEKANNLTINDEMVHGEEEKVENDEKETSQKEKGIQKDDSAADSKSKQKNDVDREKIKHDGKETKKSEKR
ncbi:Hypothetical predicted protein [Mytilus galloprovincialis]|uniref:Uncharacterized protein n=1 Tax=Mytilus galloprovincialis TaxID=29158 RepID=A0A8B6E469_MYTGA|nr:Hypothetical predicted protein [Mytilus galloprovincialis]